MEDIMAFQKIGVGVIGCGAISKTYLDNLSERFSIIHIVGVADLIEERAQKAAEKYHCKVMTNEEIYSDPEISIVVNLTNVWSHYEVSKAALEHGKHVYSEKMMAENFCRAKELYDLAQKKGVRFALAPDTFLGGGIQTCRKIIDDGFIGKPFAVTAAIVRSYLPDSVSPEGNNIFSEGGTIPFDMGGYYIHAMQNLFGAVKRVSGFCTYLPKKWSNPGNIRYGEDLTLDSPNLMQASLEFECGVLGNLLAGDYGMSEMDKNFVGPGLYVYGTAGTLYVPDPNTFGGPVKILKSFEFVELPLSHGFSGENPFLDPGEARDFWDSSYRGVGIADMAWAITNDRPQRISNEMGLHTIEIIHGVEKACTSGQYYEMTTHPRRPVALRSGFTGADAEEVFNDRFGYDFDAEPAWKW